MTDLLTPQEAADYLKLSIHTLSTWRSRQNIDGPPWIEAGGSIRYRRSDLESWIDSRTKNGSSTNA